MINWEDRSNAAANTTSQLSPYQTLRREYPAFLIDAPILCSVHVYSFYQFDKQLNLSVYRGY